MDIRDLVEIHLRLTAFDHLQRLKVLAAVHQAGKVIVADNDVPLTAGQKNILRGAFNSLAVKVNLALNALTTPTGKAGVADVAQVAEVQQVPTKLFSLLDSLLNESSRIIELLKPASSIGADGSIVALPIEAQAAQDTADSLETFASAAKWWISQESAKF